MQSPGLMCKSPSMLDGPMPKLLTPGGVLHISSDSLEPLIVMGTVEPELVNVAEPFLTMQLMGSGGGVPGQVPVAVSVAVLPLALHRRRRIGAGEF
jgi:hypothetical protein